MLLVGEGPDARPKSGAIRNTEREGGMGRLPEKPERIGEYDVRRE